MGGTNCANTANRRSGVSALYYRLTLSLTLSLTLTLTLTLTLALTLSYFKGYRLRAAQKSAIGLVERALLRALDERARDRAFHLRPAVKPTERWIHADPRCWQSLFLGT